MKDLNECHILIVDDTPSIVDLLLFALGRDYQVTVATTAVDALGKAKESALDLILLDVGLPDIDGFEVCRRLRAAPTTVNVPILFLTGATDVESKARGFAAGGNDYVTKPFAIIEIQARVKSHLQAKAYVDGLRAQYEGELRAAREIQSGILPPEVANIAADTTLEIAALMQPAWEVGGDLYEVVRCGNGRLLVAVGDVSGKGVSAALFMAVTSTLIRAAARRSVDPDTVLKVVNRELCGRNPYGLFVTIACALIDPEAKRIVWSSVGHPQPILLGASGSATELAGESGLPAGLFEDLEVPLNSAPFVPGDTLLLYSDGVTEAFDSNQQIFSLQRLVASLQGGAASAHDLLHKVLAAVDAFIGPDTPRSDDLTLFAVAAAKP